MKTVQEYLKERETMAWHNRLCYSKNFLMNEPKQGYEKEFEESVRDCEIVKELIEMASTK